MSRAAAVRPPVPAPKGMAWVPPGTFLMGSELAQFPEEAPVHAVETGGFFIDEVPVTNALFRRFVKATGYETVAERPWDEALYPTLGAAPPEPGSLVFVAPPGPVDLRFPDNWWRYVPGASWAHPEGPASNLAGREYHPVVHVCWEDVTAFADWAGKELPSEAQWERAARGGLEGAEYTWGDEFSPRGRPMANTWAGEFPWQNLKPPRQQRTTPVRSFPANGYGLFDMAGNVWEWTSDFYRTADAESGDHPCCVPLDPRVTSAEDSYDPAHIDELRIPRRVLKGGSHLCSANYCRRYRPAARQAQMVDSSMSHVGFRCIVRPEADGPTD